MAPKRNNINTKTAPDRIQIGTRSTPKQHQKRLFVKKIILIVITLIAVSGFYRATSAVIDHIRYVRSLEDSKSQLESENNTLYRIAVK